MKLFNKKRLEQIQWSGLKKYTLYAIGEILLVVVGILIALWINNWNQETTAIKQQRDIALRVMSQLKKDQTNIRKFIDTLEFQSDLFDLLLTERTLSQAERKTLDEELPYLVTVQVFILNQQDETLQILSHNKAIDNPVLKILESIESDYKYNLEMLQISEDKMVDEIMGNLNYLKNNKDWYYKLILGYDLTVEEFSYFKSNDYKNRVAQMELMSHQGYLSLLYQFEFDINNHIKELDAILKE